MEKPIKYVIKYVPKEEVDYSQIVKVVYEMLMENRMKKDKEIENDESLYPHSIPTEK